MTQEPLQVNEDPKKQLILNIFMPGLMQTGQLCRNVGAQSVEGKCHKLGNSHKTWWNSLQPSLSEDEDAPFVLVEGGPISGPLSPKSLMNCFRGEESGKVRVAFLFVIFC